MKTTAAVLTLTALVTTATPLSAQIDVYLGLLEPGTTLAVEAAKGANDIVLHHVVPSANYYYSVDTQYRKVPDPTPAEGTTRDFTTPPAGTCDALLADYDTAVRAATRESRVAAENSHYLGHAKRLGGACPVDMKTMVEALTTITISKVTIRKKYLTEITVQRRSATLGNEDWKVEVTTGPGAAWVTMPVLAVLPDGGEEWFAQSDPLELDDGMTQERYRLIREDRGTDFRPGAGVGFYFVPEKQRSKNGALHWMAGLGVNDSKTPLMFLVGGGVLLGDRVALDLGVTATWERELLGRYRGEEFIDSNLTNDQLTEEELTFRPFFSIGIHFKGFDVSLGGKKAKKKED